MYRSAEAKRPAPECDLDTVSARRSRTNLAALVRDRVATLLDSPCVEKPVIESARTSDKTTVFLTGGHLVEFDNTEKIFENPESDRVRDYITGKSGDDPPKLLIALRAALRCRWPL